MGTMTTHDALPLIVVLVLLCQLLALAANAEGATAAATPHTLQELVDRAAQTALQQYAKQGLKADELAITLVDLRDPAHPRQAAYRGEVAIYPASVVKLFYLVAAHGWLEDGKMQDTTELRRALHDMIVDSSNDATHYVLDLLTGTTSGPELPPAAMQEWEHKRNAVNRYFAAQGYANISVNQKTWGEGPYGRDRAFVGATYQNRNKLTTDATARLLTEIVTGRAITPARSRQMMELLQRDPYGKSPDADDQSHGFTGPALSQPPIPGARLWSKAGWTSDTCGTGRTRGPTRSLTISRLRRWRMMPGRASSICGWWPRSRSVTPLRSRSCARRRCRLR